jgi:hypothetical protein
MKLEPGLDGIDGLGEDGSRSDLLPGEGGSEAAKKRRQRNLQRCGKSPCNLYVQLFSTTIVSSLNSILGIVKMKTNREYFINFVSYI